MASSEFGEPWFSRNLMVPELEKHVTKRQTSSGRRVFYGADGEDLRLKQPGFNWSLINDRRHQILENFSEQVTSIFDEFYEKITGDKRSHRKSSIAPVLPSMKTPGLSRHKPKTAPIPEVRESEATHTQPTQIDLTKSTPEPSQPSIPDEPKPEEPVVDVVPEASKKTRNTRASKKRVTRLTTTDEARSSDDEDFKPTRRLTRQRARAANKNPEPTPSLRPRRARTCKAGPKKKPLCSTEDKVGSPVSLRSSAVGIDSEEILKVVNNRLSRELSVTRNSLDSTSCRLSVDVEKVSLIVGRAQPNDTACAKTTPTSKCVVKDLETTLTSVVKNVEATPTSVAKDVEVTLTKGDVETTPTLDTENIKASATESSPQNNNLSPPHFGFGDSGEHTVGDSGNKKSPISHPLPNEADSDVEMSLACPTLTFSSSNSDTMKTPVAHLLHEPDSDVEMSLARPTPPRRKALKLRKKGGAKKGLSKPKTRTVELREEGTPVVDIADILPPTDAPSILADQEAIVLPSSSADSVYESCESHLETPTKSTLQYETPPTVTKTDVIVTSPPQPSFSEAPSVDAPSYLTGTPRTLLKLREEYQSRTGGRLVSLTDLLNSGGRTGTPFNKKSAIRDQAKGGTPSKNFHAPSNSVSMVTDPIPKTPTFQTIDSSDGTEADDNSDFVSSPTPVQKTSKPKTFLSGMKPLESVLQYKEGTNQPLSFLPHRSPRKVETLKEKKAQLADKLLRKRLEEEKRREDLKNRRQLELQEKIKKREERARKVAEKQAALRMKEEEKKQRLKGQQSQDPAKKLTIKKAKEIEEKNKKLKERMMAAEARRKQEELQQQKRLQQLEEERRMAIELAQKRKEMEEEEKRIKRQEKLKQDKERHLKHMEDLREQQEELKRKLEEDSQKKLQNVEGVMKSSSGDAPASKHNELVRQFEKLIGGAIAKVPVVATPKITKVLTTGKMGDSSEKASKLLQAYYNGSQSHQSSGQPVPPQVLSPADSRLNSTFTKDSPSAVKTPLHSSHLAPTSYQMTPVENDPLYAHENYDIDNLSSGDSTDDEDHPKKVLPMWARPDALKLMMRSQEDELTMNLVDVTKIFPPEQLLKDPDLGKIFRRKRQRFYQRSSSAHWDSPILKRNKVVHV